MDFTTQNSLWWITWVCFSYSVHLSIIHHVSTTTNKGHWVSLLVYGLGLPCYFLVICLGGMSLGRFFLQEENKYELHLLGILGLVIFISKCLASPRQNNEICHLLWGHSHWLLQYLVPSPYSLIFPLTSPGYMMLSGSPHENPTLIIIAGYYPFLKLLFLHTVIICFFYWSNRLGGLRCEWLKTL